MPAETKSFRQRYTGPNGPHLNHLTYYSNHLSFRDPKFDTSIHPFGRGSGHSTAKPRREVRNTSGFGLHRRKARASANWSKSK